ncbi:MAG: hypothetical protein AAGU14_00730 [Eubacteriaceae bacterium]
MRRRAKKRKLIVYLLLLIMLIAIPYLIISVNKTYYNDTKHGFSVKITNNWVCLSSIQMKKYYKNSSLSASSSAQDFAVIFSAMKYRDKYSVKNNMPNPNIIILYSKKTYDPKELVSSLSGEIVKTTDFKYDGGNETSDIGGLKWQSRYISAEMNSLIVFQDYYCAAFNNATYLIIATSFSNENLDEVYDLLTNIKFNNQK